MARKTAIWDAKKREAGKCSYIIGIPSPHIIRIYSVHPTRESLLTVWGNQQPAAAAAAAAVSVCM